MPLCPLTLQLFGPLQILVHGEPAPRLRPRSVEWLLALLVLRQGRVIERSWLAGTLWPATDEAQARHNLRNGLLTLRKALGSEGVRLQSPTRPTLLFDLSGAEVDVIRFDQAILTGNTDALTEAVALYTGPLLDGCDEVWITQERNRREMDCLTAIETLAERAGKQGERREAIQYLQQARTFAPLHEPAVRQLMILLAESGDSAGAIEVYREFRNHLHAELNISPDTETLRLFQQIREQGKAQSGVRRLAFGVKGVTKVVEPESGAQETEGPATPESPEFSTTLVPLRIAARPPLSLSPLIGRAEDMKRLQESLRQNRLVTLVGTGGVGKTRLAREVATQNEETFVGSTIWMELGPLSEGALLLPTLAEMLELNQEVRSNPETLQTALVSYFSETASLLILDNCEHLLDAAAAVVQRLLSLCPSLHVLATSRQPLGLKGEAVWHVPSLQVPQVEDLPTDAAEARVTALTYPAVRLFVERATTARRGFALKRREETEAVCQICRRLDGIPLALEMAAARTNVLSVEQIATRLDNRFRLLTEGSRADPPRHQTLRALIDWSYDQLSEAERTLLRRLSVFVGGWSLEAAEAAFFPGNDSPDAEDALNVLSALVNKSLVMTEENWNGLRYRMLETVREYGLDKLRASGEEEIVRERHADFFLALAEEARPFIVRQDPDWLNRLDRDHDNIRAALVCLSARDETVEKAVRLAAALSKYWSLRARIYEQRTWMVGLAQRPSLPTPERVTVLVWAAERLAFDKDFAGAKRLYTEALTVSERLNDRKGRSGALNGLAWLLSDPAIAGVEYDLAAARELAEESLTIIRDLGDKEGIAQSLFRLGNLASQLGDFDAALAYLLECHQQDQEMGVKGGLVLQELGDVFLARGEYATARRYYGTFLMDRYEIGEHWGIIFALKGLSKVDLTERQWERAARFLGAAMALEEARTNRASEIADRIYEPFRSVLRDALGDAVSTRLWEQGAAMTLEQVVSFVSDTAELNAPQPGNM